MKGSQNPAEQCGLIAVVLGGTGLQEGCSFVAVWWVFGRSLVRGQTRHVRSVSGKGPLSSLLLLNQTSHLPRRLLPPHGWHCQYLHPHQNLPTINNTSISTAATHSTLKSLPYGLVAHGCHTCSYEQSLTNYAKGLTEAFTDSNYHPNLFQKQISCVPSVQSPTISVLANVWPQKSTPSHN